MRLKTSLNLSNGLLKSNKSKSTNITRMSHSTLVSCIVMNVTHEWAWNKIVLFEPFMAKTTVYWQYVSFYVVFMEQGTSWRWRKCHRIKILLNACLDTSRGSYFIIKKRLHANQIYNVLLINFILVYLSLSVFLNYAKNQEMLFISCNICKYLKHQIFTFQTLFSLFTQRKTALLL